MSYQAGRYPAYAIGLWERRADDYEGPRLSDMYKMFDEWVARLEEEMELDQ